MFFLHLFNKSILNQQIQGMLRKNAKIDILELTKLQNVLRPQPWLEQS